MDNLRAEEPDKVSQSVLLCPRKQLGTLKAHGGKSRPGPCSPFQSNTSVLCGSSDEYPEEAVAALAAHQEGRKAA